MKNNRNISPFVVKEMKEMERERPLCLEERSAESPSAC